MKERLALSLVVVWRLHHCGVHACPHIWHVALDYVVELLPALRPIRDGEVMNNLSFFDTSFGADFAIYTAVLADRTTRAVALLLGASPSYLVWPVADYGQAQIPALEGVRNPKLIVSKNCQPRSKF